MVRFLLNEATAAHLLFQFNDFMHLNCAPPFFFTLNACAASLHSVELARRFRILPPPGILNTIFSNSLLAPVHLLFPFPTPSAAGKRPERCLARPRARPARPTLVRYPNPILNPRNPRWTLFQCSLPSNSRHNPHHSIGDIKKKAGARRALSPGALSCAPEKTGPGGGFLASRHTKRRLTFFSRCPAKTFPRTSPGG